jgi:hypothetical protein
MLKNDLSNKAAPVLAFNFENVICEKFKKKLFSIDYEIHKRRVGAINQLYWKDFSIFYVTFLYPGKKLDALEEKLETLGCMFNGTIRTDDINSLLYWFRQQKHGWYYDTNMNAVTGLYPYGLKWEEYMIDVWIK